MGATNHTSNYNLSQFVGTDKPAWLQDYNGDMLKIDTGINAAKVAADSAALDASTAQGAADTANNAITNTLTPAVSALQTTVGNQGGAINTINSLIGNGTPTTTDQTIIGAINEINAHVSDLQASEIEFDDTDAGLNANNVQDAIERLSLGLTHFIVRTRENVTVNSGNDFFTVTNVPAKAGYRRVVLDANISNHDVTVKNFHFNGSDLNLYTYNFDASSQTVDVTVIIAYYYTDILHDE